MIRSNKFSAQVGSFSAWPDSLKILVPLLAILVGLLVLTCCIQLLRSRCEAFQLLHYLCFPPRGDAGSRDSNSEEEGGTVPMTLLGMSSYATLTSFSADSTAGNIDDQGSAGIISRILRTLCFHTCVPCCVNVQRRQSREPVAAVVTAEVDSMEGASTRSNTSFLALPNPPETPVSRSLEVAEDGALTSQLEDTAHRGIRLSAGSASSAGSSPQSPADTPSFIDMVSSMFALLLPNGPEEAPEDGDIGLESIFSGGAIGALFGSPHPPPQQKPAGDLESGAENIDRLQEIGELVNKGDLASELLGGADMTSTGQSVDPTTLRSQPADPATLRSQPRIYTVGNNNSTRKAEIHSHSGVVRSRSMSNAARRLGSLFLHSPMPKPSNSADPQSDTVAFTRENSPRQENTTSTSADPGSPDIYLTNAYPDKDQVPTMETLTALEEAKNPAASSSNVRMTGWLFGATAPDYTSDPSIETNAHLMLPRYPSTDTARDTPTKRPALSMSLQLPSQTSEDDTSSKKSTSTAGFTRPKSILKTSTNPDGSSRSQTPSSRGNRVVFFEEPSEADPAAAPINGQKLLANRLLHRGQGSGAAMGSPKRSIIAMMSAALAITPPLIPAGGHSDEEDEVDIQVQVRTKRGTLLQRGSSLVKGGSGDELPPTRSAAASQSPPRQQRIKGSSSHRKQAAPQATGAAKEDDIVIHLDGSSPSRGSYSPLRLFTPPRSPRTPVATPTRNAPEVEQIPQDQINSKTSPKVKEQKKAKSKKKPPPLPSLNDGTDVVEVLSGEAAVVMPPYPSSPVTRNRQLLSGAPSPEVRRQYSAAPPAVKHPRSSSEKRRRSSSAAMEPL